MAACHSVHDQIVAQELASAPDLQAVRRFRRLNRFFQSIPKVRWFWNRFVFSALYQRDGAYSPAGHPLRAGPLVSPNRMVSRS